MAKEYRLGKNNWRTLHEGSEREWLLSNGIGGFSNYTVIGNMSRMQSAYLVAALNPPVDRISILTNICESLKTDTDEFNLNCQEYTYGECEGYKYLESFSFDIIPKYTYQMNDIRMTKEISLEYGKNTVVVKYKIINGIKNASIKLKPIFGCRENCSSTGSKEKLDLECFLDKDITNIINNKDKRYEVKFYCSQGKVTKRDKDNIYECDKVYLMETKNGYNYEDIGYTPIDINIDIEAYSTLEFYIKCTIEQLDDKDADTIINQYKDRSSKLLDKLRYRDMFTERLAISADTFIVERASTGLKTILAGFPWFTDWGRDTMIALQGLTLCTGRFDDTKDILLSFAKYIKNGLIPNVFPSTANEEPMYNTVDASMWYFYSVDRYLTYTGKEEDYTFVKENIYDVLKQIIKYYSEGTDFSIKMKEDYLISAGSGVDQVTWMDVRVGEWVVTPRHGKPVEINALWYNALKVMEKLSSKFGEDGSYYGELAVKVKESFNNRFWNEDKQCLYDVVDEDDDKIRPNQICAIWLPYTMLDRDKEIKVVNTVYEHLYTCYGMRTLSYRDAQFKDKYIGKLEDRDAAYHMGTVWPYLMGGFITAFCKVNDYSEESIERAREMCVACFDHLEDGCLNGISEVFDGFNPCTGNGCFNQAWSIGEMLRAYTEDVLFRGQIKKD